MSKNEMTSTRSAKTHSSTGSGERNAVPVRRQILLSHCQPDDLPTRLAITTMRKHDRRAPPQGPRVCLGRSGPGKRARGPAAVTRQGPKFSCKYFCASLDFDYMTSVSIRIRAVGLTQGSRAGGWRGDVCQSGWFDAGPRLRHGPAGFGRGHALSRGPPPKGGPYARACIIMHERESRKGWRGWELGLGGRGNFFVTMHAYRPPGRVDLICLQGESTLRRFAGDGSPQRAGVTGVNGP